MHNTHKKNTPYNNNSQVRVTTHKSQFLKDPYALREYAIPDGQSVAAVEFIDYILIEYGDTLWDVCNCQFYKESSFHNFHI